jgi:hypothetical protein
MLMAYMQKKNKQTKQEHATSGAVKITSLDLASMLPGHHNLPPPPPSDTTFPGYLSLPPPLPRTPLLSSPPSGQPRDSSRSPRRRRSEREMGPQRKLVYSFVARGSAVLTDHAEASGNFATVAAECLQKLPASNNRFSYNCDGHTFNYHVHDGFSNVPDLDVPCCSSPF